MASITALRSAITTAVMPRPPQAGEVPLMSSEALVLEGVTRAFGALRAVDDVSLSVLAGEKRAILGANGAGKTTLFNAITGDFAPTAGRIRFFGEDITHMDPFERIRKGMRRTYQSSLLFKDLSVRDNLFLAVRGVSNARFSLRRPGPGHPSSVATQELLERGRLTHIADEMVSNRELVLLLTSLPSHMSFVLIEHDLEIALRVVERVTVMHNGSVIKTGTPSEIENDQQVQAIYMGGKH